MLKSLLVGTNGSQWSQMAVDLALAWAKPAGAAVTFLGVVEDPALTDREAMPPGGSAWKHERDERLLLEARTRVGGAVEAAVARAAAAGVSAQPLVVEGDAVRALAHEIQRHDLLIVGQRVAPRSDHDPEPSDTVEDILHRAPRPVVVATATVPTASAVLVAYDGSRQAARAVASFVATGIHEQQPVHVLGVDDGEIDMQDRVQKAVDFLTAHGRTAQGHVVPEGKGVDETVTDHVRSLSAGLLVMGAYGESRFREMIFGSTTRTLLAHAGVPILLDH